MDVYVGQQSLSGHFVATCMGPHGNTYVTSTALTFIIEVIPMGMTPFFHGQFEREFDFDKKKLTSSNSGR